MTKKPLRYKKDESGMIENIFLVLITVAALLALGTFAKTALSAQRYKAGLDLATRNTLRYLILNIPIEDPNAIAQRELDLTFAQMDLSTTRSIIYVNDPQQRCGKVTVEAYKILYPLWDKSIVLHLSASQSEAQDTFASGLAGTAVC